MKISKVTADCLKSVKTKFHNYLKVIDGHGIACNGKNAVRIVIDLEDGLYCLDHIINGLVKKIDGVVWVYGDSNCPDHIETDTEFQLPHLSYCDFVSTDLMRLALMGVLVANNSAMCATDGTFAQWNQLRDADTEDIIIQPPFIKLATKLKATSFHKVGKYSYVRVGVVQLWFREIEGPYPRYEQVVGRPNKDGDSEHELMPDTLAGMTAEFNKYYPLQDKRRCQVSPSYWKNLNGEQTALEFKLPERSDGRLYAFNAKKLFGVVLKNAVQATMELGPNPMMSNLFTVKLKDGRIFNRLLMPLRMMD